MFNKKQLLSFFDPLYVRLTAHMAQSGLMLFAFDPNDPKDKAILDEAVAKAVEEATTGLSTKNKELLDKLAKAKKGGDVDPAEVERLERENEELRTKLTASERAAKDATKNLDTLTKQLTGEKGFTQKLLIDNGLTSALVAAGVNNPVLMKAAKAMLAGQITIKEDGDNRSAMVGDKALGDFVKEWSASDEGKQFVAAQTNSGGGATGAGGQGGDKPTITRQQFEGMDASARHAHFAAGGKITD